MAKFLYLLCLCFTLHSSVMQVSAGNCESGWISNPTMQTCLKFNTTLLTDFNNALYICQMDNDANLVTITDDATNDLIAANLDLNETYWIGLNDKTTEGQYIWQSDSSNMTFVKWDDGEPRSDIYKFDCGIIGANTTDKSRWRIEDCNMPHAFVCERYMVRNTTTAAPTTLALTTTTTGPLPPSLVTTSGPPSPGDRHKHPTLEDCFKKLFNIGHFIKCILEVIFHKHDFNSRQLTRLNFWNIRKLQRLSRKNMKSAEKYLLNHIIGGRF